MNRGQHASLVERDDALAGRLGGGYRLDPAAGAAERARPDAVDVEQPDAGRLEPAEHAFGLRRRGGRGRSGTGDDRLRARDQARGEGTATLPGTKHSARGEPAVAYDVHLPAAVVEPTGRDDLGAAGQGR